MMPQTRISPDVWELAGEVATARGLGSPRVALEAVMRIYAKSYIGGDAPKPEKPIASTTPSPTAQDALSNLIASI